MTKRLSWVVLAAVLSCGAAHGVEPTKGDDGQFSDMLKVEPMKRRGLIKAKVEIVRSPENAVHILEASITCTRHRRKKSIRGTDRPNTVASVIAYNRCDLMVWSKTKGDKNIFGNAGGPIDTAEKAAASGRCRDSPPRHQPNRVMCSRSQKRQSLWAGPPCFAPSLGTAESRPPGLPWQLAGSP